MVHYTRRNCRNFGLAGTPWVSQAFSSPAAEWNGRRPTLGVPRKILTGFPLAGALVLAGCGGGSSSNPAAGPAPTAQPQISGVAAIGSPITPAMNGVVTIQDSASPAHTATTPTDASGNYSFTGAQLSGWTAPYMMEVDYKVAGIEYNLHSAATAADLTNGSATINITPLTDLVISNLAGTIAANVFKNQAHYASQLTSTALAAGTAALAAQLQPVLAAEGVSVSVDLFRTSFSANGTGLDAVLDSLNVIQDPITNTATITSRLNGSSVTDVLGTSNTATLSAPAAAVPITDLQAITNYFASFSTEMTGAPAANDPALLAFFDQTSFLQDGQSLAAFLQQVTTNPKILGGTLSFGNIVLDSVPSWVTNVPSAATASYKVRFTVLMNGYPNSREEFIMYKNNSGNWVALGNQKVAKVKVAALETSGPIYSGSNVARVNCTGLFPQVNDKGGIGINFAVVTGPGLPSAGLLLYADANGTNASDFMLAAGGPSTYAGTATAPASANLSACGFSSLYPFVNDADIAAIAASTMQYTIKLYKDVVSGTPNALTATLVATYKTTLAAAPLTNAQLSSSLFASGSPVTSAILTDANGATVVSETISWAAPTAANLYGTSAGIWVGNNSSTVTGNTYGWVNTNISAGATSASLAVPLVPGANYAGVTIDYMDSLFRDYWTSF